MRAEELPREDVQSVTIRPPRGLEVRGCRMLLPETFGPGVRWNHLIAVGGPPLSILGAAACAADRHRGRPALRVSLRVARPYRRRRVGSRLLDALRETARQARIDTLLTHQCPSESPEGAAFLHRSGFLPSDRVITFEAETGRMDFLRSLRGRISAREKDGPSARIVPLKEAPLEQVAQLQMECLGGTYPTLLDQLNRAVDRETTADASVVWMTEDGVQGVFLAELDGRLAVVSSCVVAPRHRGGCANALLKEEGLRRIVAGGAHRIRFGCFSTNRDTCKFASRCAAEVVEVIEIYILTLAGDAGA